MKKGGGANSTVPPSQPTPQTGPPQQVQQQQQSYAPTSASVMSVVVAAQIRSLLSTLTAQNWQANTVELFQIISLYGSDAFLYSLRVLFESVDVKDKTQKDVKAQAQMLRDQLIGLSKQPNFTSVICQVIDGVPGTSEESYLQELASALKLPFPAEVMLALALVRHTNQNLAQCGLKRLHAKISELIQTPSKLTGFPEGLLQALLHYIETEESLEKFRGEMSSLISENQLALSPLLTPYADNTSSEPVDPSVALPAIHPAHLIPELGFACMTTHQSLRSLLEHYPKPLTEYDLALIVSAMTKVTSSQSDDLQLYLNYNGSSDGIDEQKVTGWNSSIFADVMKELYPKLQWTTVIRNLDHPGFFLNDQKGLILIMNLFKKCSKDPFPLGHLFEDWQNKSGQLSFLKHALALTTSASADPFNFINAPRRQSPADVKGSQPIPNNLPWLSVVFIETLLRLSESENYAVVRSLFDHPLKNYPELLLLGLSQVKTGVDSQLRKEVLNHLLGMVLGSHPNFSLLHKLWLTNSQVVVQAFRDMYLRDHTLLSHILDVAHQEQKTNSTPVLPTILSARPFTFAIDLASLASQREFLNLELWLQEQLSQHGESFAASCLFYLREKSVQKNSKLVSNFLLTPETQRIILRCLNESPCSGELSKACQDELKLIESCLTLPTEPGKVAATSDSAKTSLPSAQPTTVPAVLPATSQDTSSTPVRGYPPEIEQIANEYFHQIYTEQKTVEEIMPVLKRLGSAKKNTKEREIFNCMINNLFSEYQFFPKYRDKELHTTGVLVGALIQNQVVTFLHLGVALRYVLEALRQKPGTKMFSFGLWALEQFMSRLHEWPQYCSHILQNHPDIISFIEKAVTGQPANASTQNAFSSPPTSPRLETPPILGSTGSPRPEDPQKTTRNSFSPAAVAPSTSSSRPAIVAPIPQHALPVIDASPFTPANLQQFSDRPSPNVSQQYKSTSLASPGVNVSPAVPSPGTQSSLQQLASLTPDTQRTVQAPAIQTSSQPEPLNESEIIMMRTPIPIDTLRQSQRRIVQPPVPVMDRMHFIINNICQSNMDQKVSEMRELLKTEHVEYLAQYLVTHRLSVEASNHQLYLSFLDTLGNAALTQLVLKLTYENIKILLNSEKIRDTSDKSLLKTLGSWLGLITLSRNKPVVQRELAVKDMLIQSVANGKLVPMVTFVAKVLESAGNSRVFRPPNPWIMALLHIFAEIYDFPNIKMNTKFEIELLFDAVHQEIAKLKPATPQIPEKLAQLATQQPQPITKNDIQPTDMLLGPSLIQTQPVSQQPTLQSPVQSPTLPAHTPPQIQQHLPAIPVAQVTLTPREMAKIGANDTIIPDLQSYVHVMPNVALNQTPQLTTLVTIAVDKAIQRSVTIGCLTTQHLTMKDFALEPDETKMRRAAHLMVQSLAGSLALVTCKEPLRVSMGNHLRSLLVSTLQGLDPQQLQQQQQYLDQAVQTICSDNLELACSIIEKAATDKALADTDEAFSQAFATRRKFREMRPNTIFCDPTYMQRFPSQIPEPLRAKPGGLATQQLQVYEDFANVPHPLPSPKGPASPDFAGKSEHMLDPDSEGANVFNKLIQEKLSPQDALERFAALLVEVDKAVVTVMLHPPSDLQGEVSLTQLICSLTVKIRLAYLQPEHVLHQLVVAGVANIVTQSATPTETAVMCAHKLCGRLYERDGRLHREVHLAMLETLADLSRRIVQEITSLVLYIFEEDKKMHRDNLAGLICSQLLLLPEVDNFFTRIIDNGRNRPALEFVMFMFHECIIDNRCVVSSDFPSTMDLLTKLSRGKQGDIVAANVTKLLDDLHNLTPSGKEDRSRLRKLRPAEVLDKVETPDPPGFREQVGTIFNDWCTTYQQSSANVPSTDKAWATFLAQPQLQAIFKTEDLQERFFRICIEVSIESCTSQINQDSPYQQVDAFGKLVVLLVTKCIPEQHAASKITMLTRVLGIFIKVLLKDHEEKKKEFNQRPFFRLLDLWLLELNSPDQGLGDALSQQVLVAFSNLFLVLQPSRVPGFAFAWLELISHRMFMPKLLLSKFQKGWPLMQRLLVELLRFLEPYLRNAEMNDSIRLLYKGTLRVLLVLLHDFPEFLCDFHFSFCDAIPPTCIQMRNLILSAFPRNMRLPDPFTPNLKVDLLPEIQSSPRVLANYSQSLNNAGIKQDLDQYLKSCQPVTFLLDLKLLLPPDEALRLSSKYNTPLINSLVLYVGMQAITHLHSSKSGTAATPSISQTAPMDIFQYLAMDLDTEGRFLFLNAIANQLRYPNTHTHYFSCVLLYLFAEAPQEIIQEQITRVLLERLVVSRPHPWGLLITFIELIKNPRYSFWSHSFTRCAPEIERLFESVARSCMNPHQPPQPPPS